MNWGYKITLGISLFIGFILFLVFQAFQHSIELVSDDYYAMELNFQETINAKANAAAFKHSLRLKKDDRFVYVDFSNQSENLSGAKGTIHFYKPNNVGDDVTLPLELNTNIQAIPVQSFKNGEYLVKISFKLDGMDYYIEENMTL